MRTDGQRFAITNTIENAPLASLARVMPCGAVYSRILYPHGERARSASGILTVCNMGMIIIFILSARFARSARYILVGINTQLTIFLLYKKK